MSRLPIRFTFVVCAAFAFGCGTSGSQATTAAAAKDVVTAQDAGADAQAPTDASADAGADASKDGAVGKDAGQTGADAKADVEPVESLDDFITNRLDFIGVPGLAAGVVKNGKLTWSKAYGEADVDEGTPLTLEHLMRISGVSETVVAIAVMQQVEAGKLSLDEDVSKYLPFPVKNPKAAGKITVRQLLTYTSSLNDRDGLYAQFDLPGDPTLALADFDANYLKEGGNLYSKDNFLDEAPGTTSQYSSVGIGLAAHVVEIVAKQTFEQYCQDKIFKPLGMTATGWHLKDIDAKKLATPHAIDENDDYVTLDQVGYPYYPSGTLYTNVKDFTRIIAVMSLGGSVDGVSVLKPASVVEIFKEQFGDIENAGGQGFAWYEYELDTIGKLYAAFAGDYGWHAEAWLLADKKAGVLVLVNGEVLLDEESGVNDALDEVVSRLIEEAAKP